MVQQLLGDRAEKQLGKSALAPGTDDRQLRILRCRHQRGAGSPWHQAKPNGHLRVFAHHGAIDSDRRCRSPSQPWRRRGPAVAVARHGGRGGCHPRTATSPTTRGLLERQACGEIRCRRASGVIGLWRPVPQQCWLAHYGGSGRRRRRIGVVVGVAMAVTTTALTGFAAVRLPDRGIGTRRVSA